MGIRTRVPSRSFLCWSSQLTAYIGPFEFVGSCEDSAVSLATEDIAGLAFADIVRRADQRVLRSMATAR